MEKPEQMFWPAQYTEYNIEEKIVIMLENVHFFLPSWLFMYILQTF